LGGEFWIGQGSVKRLSSSSLPRRITKERGCEGNWEIIAEGNESQPFPFGGGVNGKSKTPKEGTALWDGDGGPSRKTFRHQGRPENHLLARRRH